MLLVDTVSSPPLAMVLNQPNWIRGGGANGLAEFRSHVARLRKRLEVGHLFRPPIGGRWRMSMMNQHVTLYPLPLVLIS